MLNNFNTWKKEKATLYIADRLTHFLDLDYNITILWVMLRYVCL